MANNSNMDYVASIKPDPAWIEGRKARRDGVSRCGNPYQTLTKEYDEWNLGHLDWYNTPTNGGHRFL